MAPDSYLAVKSHSLAAYCSSVAVFFFREEPTTACPTLGQGKQFTVVDKLANCALGLSMSPPIPTIFFMVTLSDKFDSPKLQHHIQQLPTNHRLTGVFNVTSLIDSAIRNLLYINHHKFFVLTSRKYATPKFRSFFLFSFPSSAQALPEKENHSSKIEEIYLHLRVTTTVDTHSRCDSSSLPTSATS